METQNENQSVDAGLSKLFDEYEKSHQKFTKKSKEEIFQRYFVPRKETEIFRILPPLGSNYVEIAYFHYVKAGNRYQKLFCPKHNDNTDCALCNVVDKLTKLEDNGVKQKTFNKVALTEEEKVIKGKNDKIYEEKKKWMAAKYYILKGVDKQVMKDGAKYWRFKFNKRKEGVMDKFVPLFKQYSAFNNGLNFTDLKQGADFIITTADKPMPNNPNRTYKAVTAINTRGPISLGDDDLILAPILSDKSTWRDVFKKRNPPHITYEEYLTLITQGKAPYYDETDPKNKRWVYPGNPELELKANTRTNAQASTSDESSLMGDEDDLDNEVLPPVITSQQLQKSVGVDVTSGVKETVLSNQSASAVAVTDDDINKLPF